MALKKIISIYKLIIITLFYAALSANTHSGITWMMSGRVHTELNWYTIETQNFNIHYHAEIEKIAMEGANISEQVLPVLMKQLNISEIPKIDIILTSEDEIMNGFALPINTTFIWVDQNDAAIWIENGKWLEQVIAHELQHIIFFNKVKTWLPEPYNAMTNPDIPGWFVEGIAEYYTEEWRPYRSEIRHKYHVITNSTSNMDPHHDGYSKIKLLAQTYGDSSIVNLLEYRTDKLKIFQFDDAFKHATGISVSEFNESWRRTMNTYYYGFRAQKEAYEDAGEVLKLPIAKLSSLVGSFKFTNDSLQIAMIGKDDKNQEYSSLIIGTIDTISYKKKKNADNLNNDKKDKDEYIKTEIDFGKFHSSMSWADNNRYLAYSKYHYANNKSMVWDLCIYDIKLEKRSWLTNNMRATYPIFKNDNEIIFVAHENSVANLFIIDITDNKISPITDFTEDTQIISPSISKDKDYLSFSMSKEDGNLDIYTINITTGDLYKKTSHEAVDYLPIIDKDNNIIFTSHRTGIPNLFKLDQNNDITQCTDLSEGIWGIQQLNFDGMVIGNTLNDVDSSRIVKVDPNRIAQITSPSFNPRFKLWKDRNPDIKIDIKNINRNKYDYSNNIKKYSTFKNIKHVSSAFLPVPGILLFETMWTDALMRNTIISTAGNYYNIIDLYSDLEYNSLGNFIFFSYTNAKNGPLMGINYFYNNLNYFIRFYNGSTLLERMDGINFWINLPYNSGYNLHANHSLTAEFISANRTAILSNKDINLIDNQVLYENDSDVVSETIPEPESGWENILAINYKYLNRKPHKNNYYLPSHGFGIESRLEYGNRPNNLYYQKYSMDSFINYQISTFILYSRFKLESTRGNIFPQDKIFFSNDQPIYVSGMRGSSDDIFEENLKPRGWKGNPILGNNMLLHTVELRMGIPILLPVEVLGIKPGKISVALFQDYGAINNKLENTASIQTLGAEIKLSFLSFNSPILFLSHGFGQTLKGWKNENTPNYYIQFSLINPF